MFSKRGSVTISIQVCVRKFWAKSDKCLFLEIHLSPVQCPGGNQLATSCISKYYKWIRIGACFYYRTFARQKPPRSDQLWNLIIKLIIIRLNENPRSCFTFILGVSRYVRWDNKNDIKMYVYFYIAVRVCMYVCMYILNFLCFQMKLVVA